MGACLDVLEIETSSFEKIDLINQQVMEELLTKEEVLFSPHIAGWSSEAKEKMAQVIIKKIERFLIE